MADGKVKATLIASGIFRWQRFPFVPVRHSPWSHLQVACFPRLRGQVGEMSWTGKAEQMILNGDVQIYKWGPTVLKVRGFGGVEDWSHSLQRFCFQSGSHSRDDGIFIGAGGVFSIIKIIYHH